MLTSTASVADRERFKVKKEDGVQVVLQSLEPSVETATGAARVDQPHDDLRRD